MQSALVQTLYIQIHGILKGHGAEAEVSLAHTVEKSVEVHFV
jgi:hypothetical protein